MIKETEETVGNEGISQVELEIDAKTLMTASISVFETNARMAQSFIFYKKCGLSFDLFDKRGALLSILEVRVVNNIARQFCKESFLSTIRVGRSTRSK